MQCWKVVLDNWFQTVTSQANDLLNFNADEWSKIFQTSTYCIPNSDDNEEFDPTYLTLIKQVFDKPLFDKFIEQDIAQSNPLTLTHQTYLLDIVQWQDKIKPEKIKTNRHEDVQTVKTD